MRSFFSTYIVNNFGLKVLAVLIAVGLWWVVSRDPMVESIVTAPIEFLHAPENLVMTADSPFEIHVAVSGPERIIRSMDQAEINAIIDLAGVKPGERTFDLGPKQIHVPRGVKVERVVPSQIHIEFNPSATRTVEVHPRVIGAFVSGYGITDVTPDPTTIVIEGPANRVSAIETAITDPVDATGVMGKATFTTHAYVPDPLVRIQHPAPIHVTVTTGKSSMGAGKH